jgi:hypothetical protein
MMVADKASGTFIGLDNNKDKYKAAEDFYQYRFV